MGEGVGQNSNMNTTNYLSGDSEIISVFEDMPRASITSFTSAALAVVLVLAYIPVCSLSCTNFDTCFDLRTS